MNEEEDDWCEKDRCWTCRHLYLEADAREYRCKVTSMTTRRQYDVFRPTECGHFQR